MLKKTFSIIFAALLIAASAITAGAYEVTGFSLSDSPGLLTSLDTGEILYQKDIDQKVYPASIAKIMTVTLMLESELYNPEGKVTMTKEIIDILQGTGSSVSGLKAGEEITQLDLLHLVLVSSYGDCAHLAAQIYGGGDEAFVQMMNSKAVKLGMTKTHYSNPTGLHDPETYTTVRDIWILAKYALQNETFKAVCGIKRYTIPATNLSAARTISTTNFLLDNATNYYYQYASGVKTGYTDEAGRCLVSTASYNGYTYLCILMNRSPKAPARLEFSESANLYRWAFNNFSYKQAADSKNPVCEIPVELSFETDFLPLYLAKSFVAVLPNDADESTIVIEPHLKSPSVDAPIKKGDILGQADIIYAEQVIGTVDLVAGRDVSSNLLLVVVRAVKRFFGSFYWKILLAAAGLAVLVFIAMCIRLNIGRGKKRKVKYKPYNERKEKETNEKH